jgi:hypothetical protein
MEFRRRTAPVAKTIPRLPPEILGAELREAFATIRAAARAIAHGTPTAMIPITVQLQATENVLDHKGRSAFWLEGRVADALVWTTLKLFSEVPRSLIRPCALAGCDRIYVAAKNQRYCHPHQREAHRQAQRRAEHAFRARQRAKKKEEEKEKKKKKKRTQ